MAKAKRKASKRSSKRRGGRRKKLKMTKAAIAARRRYRAAKKGRGRKKATAGRRRRKSTAGRRRRTGGRRGAKSVAKALGIKRLKPGVRKLLNGCTTVRVNGRARKVCLRRGKINKSKSYEVFA